jgi:transcriptional regulator with XRE-family HTH domain
MAKLVSEELARMGSDLTISQAAWSDYERDITPPSLAVIRAASRVSGVSEIYITYGVAMPPNNGQSTLIPPPPTVPPTAPLEEVAPRERAVTKRRGRAG